MKIFSKTSSPREMSTKLVSKNVKLGKDGQKPIDVFFNTSENPEMSQNENQVVVNMEDGSWIEHANCQVIRSYVCSKCGAEHVEVPCVAHQMRCHQCNNTKRNIELGDDIYDQQTPDYFRNENELDTQDQRFNFKEFAKFKTEKHQERLGTLEGLNDTVLIDQINPCEFVPVYKTPINVPYLGTLDFHDYKFVPSKELKGTRPTEALVKDKLILKSISEQIQIIPQDGDREIINMVKNKMRRSIRIVEMLTSEEKPAENDIKFGNQNYVFMPVQLNTWKMILGECKQALSMISYEFDPTSIPMSPKQFSDWTWKHFMAPNRGSGKGYKEIIATMPVNKQIEAFVAIIPQPVPESALIREYNLGGQTMIVMSDPSYIETKKIVNGDEIKVLIDPMVARMAQKDWLALRGTIGVEVWHNENYKPKFSYQSYLFKVARRLNPKERQYFNARTDIWKKSLDEESVIPMEDNVIDINNIYAKKNPSFVAPKYVPMKWEFMD